MKRSAIRAGKEIMREEWILKNPFNCGEPLTQTSAERRREKILSLEEESRLLTACEHPQRGFLMISAERHLWRLSKEM